MKKRSTKTLKLEKIKIASLSRSRQFEEPALITQAQPWQTRLVICYTWQANCQTNEHSLCRF
jgi:hypothetical protein